MAEKEYLEREALLDYIDKNIPRMKRSKDGRHPISIEAVRNFIATFDAADVEPVIRCKDCSIYPVCCRTIRSNGNRPDDFCSYGERKELENA